MASHDLSAYELLRLENIRRNNEFLASLGIEQHKPVVVKKEVIQQIKTPKRSIKSDRIETQPQRSSKRIKGLTPVKYENNDEEVADADPNLAPDEVEGINYEAMPEVMLFTQQIC